MSGEPFSAPEERADARPDKRPRLRRWFVSGFLVVFVGMAVFVRMHSMDPSGEAVTELPLGLYYVREAIRMLNSHGALGPGSGSGWSVALTLLVHVACAIVGGAMLTGVGAIVRRIGRNKRVTP